MDAFRIKRGDQLPEMTAVLSDESGVFSIPVGSTLVFVFRSPSGAVYRRPATILDNASGSVKWSPSEEDTAVAGKGSGEFEVLDPQNRPRTFPLEGSIPVTVYEDLG